MLGGDALQLLAVERSTQEDLFTRHLVEIFDQLKQLRARLFHEARETSDQLSEVDDHIPQF